MLVNSGPDPYGASREHARDGACAAAAWTRLARIDTRGSALSSAILYLAIVAIWAVVLVPRWLHPRSAQPEPVEPVPVPEPAEPEPAVRETAEPVSLAAGADRAEQAGPAPGEPAPAFPSSAERRADMLRARRRMLTA